MRRAALMLLLCASALRAQEEPTPFWMPPPPPAKKAPTPTKKPPAKKPPPKKAAPAPVVKKEKPPKPAPKPPAAKKPKPAEEEAAPTWVEPPKKRQHAPIEPEPEPTARKPAPVATPAPQPPAPAVVTPAPSEAPPAVVAPEPVVAAEPEPEQEAAPLTLRRVTVDAIFGGWGKSRSDGSGHSWDMAYGLRGGFAFSPSFELELQLVRAPGSSGSPFVSATDTQNLVALRAFWVLGDRWALLLGGGGGVTLAQTHYTLQPTTDPSVPATGLDANAIKTVIEITAAGRARIFRGLEARAEVSAVARDGRLELLPLMGLGAAF